MSQPLFRTEVLQARRRQWLGAVSLDQPPAACWLAAWAALACTGVVWLLLNGDYTRRTQVAGQLVPDLGVATVVAPVAGTVARLPVQEGQRVLGGDAVAVIAIPGATTRGGTGDALARSLQQRREGAGDAVAAQERQLQADVEAMRHQRSLALAEVAALAAELDTRQRQLALAESTLSRYRTLHAQRYVTDMQLQQQEAAALEQRASLQALERQVLATRRLLAQADQALQAAPQTLAQLRADAAREAALLAQEDTQLQARRESLVQAPLAGVVATLLVQPGQGVQAGQPLLSLLPAATTLEAHLAVPGHVLGFVAPGDRVLLRYAAFPYQKYGQHGGRVLRVSAVALPTVEAGGEPLFRVVVRPDRQRIAGAGREQPLRAGLRLDAHLLGERRRLWEWVLEPVQTLRASLADDADTDAPCRKDADRGVRAAATPAANAAHGERGDLAEVPCGAALRPSTAPTREWPDTDAAAGRPLAADAGKRGRVAVARTRRAP